MVAAFVGSLLLIGAVAVYYVGRRSEHRSERMRREALRRYAIDAQNDQSD
jgi:Tfp pilus assembly protein PilW